MAGALKGIRVVEAGTGVAPAYCGRLLAGLGADVIKLEPPEGDPLRREGPFPGDVPDPERSGLFLHLNTGKRSVLRTGPTELSSLLPGADVLILAHSPTEIRAAGIGLEGSGFPYDEASAVEAKGPTFEQGWRLMAEFLDVR